MAGTVGRCRRRRTAGPRDAATRLAAARDCRRSLSGPGRGHRAAAGAAGGQSGSGAGGAARPATLAVAPGAPGGRRAGAVWRGGSGAEAKRRSTGRVLRVLSHRPAGAADRQRIAEVSAPSGPVPGRGRGAGDEDSSGGAPAVAGAAHADRRQSPDSDADLSVAGAGRQHHGVRRSRKPARPVDPVLQGAGRGVAHRVAAGGAGRRGPPLGPRHLQCPGRNHRGRNHHALLATQPAEKPGADRGGADLGGAGGLPVGRTLLQHLVPDAPRHPPHPPPHALADHLPASVLQRRRTANPAQQPHRRQPTRFVPPALCRSPRCRCRSQRQDPAGHCVNDTTGRWLDCGTKTDRDGAH